MLPSGSRLPTVGVLVAIGTDQLVTLYYYILFSAMNYNKGDRWVYSLTIH